MTKSTDIAVSTENRVEDSWRLPMNQQTYCLSDLWHSRRTQPKPPCERPEARTKGLSLTQRYIKDIWMEQLRLCLRERRNCKSKYRLFQVSDPGQTLIVELWVIKFDWPTCKQGLGYWAWWPRLGGRVRRSSRGPPRPVCRGARPPRTGPGMRTGSPGCGGSSGGLGSHSPPAGRQPLLRCRELAGLETQGTRKWRTEKRLDIEKHSYMFFLNTNNFGYNGPLY